VPITPVDRAGALVDFSPARAAFPEIQAGRHPHHHFRGLLRLHSRYGPLDCSAAQGGLCHEASALTVTRQSRSSATRPIDNYLGGTFLHWCYAPSGRTEFSGVETAAAREVAEETGLSVAPEQFLITGLISLTKLNQVHILMNAVIDRAPDLTPQLPETTEIKWFSKQDFPKDDIWTPYHYRRLSPEMLFWPVENGGYRFFQETDSRRRAILTEAGLHHPWRAIE
jgi:8-oxo-dGTP pyrophosphatase MutT (NUDIX family)